MFGRVGEAMVRRRWIVIGVWLAVLVVGGVIGGKVFGRAADVPNLSPSAESMVAKARIDQLKPRGPVIEAALLGMNPVDAGIAVNTWVTFEIIFTEGSHNFQVVWHQLGSDAMGQGGSAVIGIENSTGTVGFEYQFQQASLLPDHGVTFISPS